MVQIGNTFDMARAQTNAKYAYEAWKDYVYADNTVGMLPEEFEALEQQYYECLCKWTQWAEETDSTDYQLSDEDWDAALAEGHYNAENITDEEGNVHHYDGENGMVDTAGGAILSATGVGIASIGGSAVNGALTGGIAGSAALSNAGSKVMVETTSKALSQGKSLTDAAMQGGKASKAMEGSWMIAAPLTLAVATLYTATQPNRDAWKQLMAIKETIFEGSLPAELGAAIVELGNLENAVLDARTRAAETAEKFDVNAEGFEGDIARLEVLKSEKEVELAEAKAEEKRLQILYETSKGIYDQLLARINAGETLPQGDLNKLNQVGNQIGALQNQITAIQDKIRNLGLEIEGIKNALLSKSIQMQEEQADGVAATEEENEAVAAEQAAYDEQGANIVAQQGAIDEAASYDTQTQTLAIVESVSQGANAVNAAFASVKAFIAAAASLGTNAYAWACGAMGAAAAIMSGVGVGQQIKYAVDIGKEIAARETAQGNINDALATYDYSMDTYANLTDETIVFNHGIAAFEFETPDLSVVNYTPENAPPGWTPSNVQNPEDKGEEQA